MGCIVGHHSGRRASVSVVRARSAGVTARDRPPRATRRMRAHAARQPVPGHPHRALRPCRGAVRRPARAQPARRGRSADRLDLSRAPAAKPHRRVAPPGTRAPARRPAAHLVPVHARPAGRVPRRDARPARAGPAGPADERRGDHEHRPPCRAGAPRAGHRSRCARPLGRRPGGVPDDDGRGAHRRARRGLPGSTGRRSSPRGSRRGRRTSGTSSSPRARPARRRA